MARGNGNAGATAEGTQPAGEGSVAVTAGTDGAGASGGGGGRVRPDRSYVVVPLPKELKARFEEESKAADKPVGPYVRDLLAKFLGIEIPATVSTRRSKYESDEQRKAAQKARNKDRSATMRDLMAEFRKLTKAGMSPDQAASQAASNVANGTATGGEAAASAPAEAPTPEAAAA